MLLADDIREHRRFRHDTVSARLVIRWMEIQEIPIFDTPFAPPRQLPCSSAERIQVHYRLTWDRRIVLEIPAFRLRAHGAPRATLWQNGKKVLSMLLPVYGAGPCRTAERTELPMPDVKGKEIALRVQITCGKNTVYDSGDSLYRRILCFYEGREITPASLGPGTYVIAAPAEASLKAGRREVLAGPWPKLAVKGMKSSAIAFRRGCTMNVEGREMILAEDTRSLQERFFTVSFPGTGPMDLFLERSGLFYIPADTSCQCRLEFGFWQRVARRNYDLYRNGELQTSRETRRGRKGAPRVEECPLKFNKDGICMIAVESIGGDQTAYVRELADAGPVHALFSRSIFITEQDWHRALWIGDGCGRRIYQEITPGDLETCLPWKGGYLRQVVPVLWVRESSGTWLRGEGSVCSAWFIPPWSEVYVTGPRCMDYYCELLLDDELLDSGCGKPLKLGRKFFASRPADPDRISDLDLQLSIGSTPVCRVTLVRICWDDILLREARVRQCGNWLVCDLGGTFYGRPDTSYVLDLLPDEGKAYVIASMPLTEGNPKAEIPSDMRRGWHRWILRTPGGKELSRGRVWIR